MTDISRLAEACARLGESSSDYDLNPGLRPAARELRPAAVLVGICEGQVILTKRASHLKHHPGQIALPGGKVDQADDGVIATALRESREEVGLPSDLVEIAGTLPPHETVTGFMVTPVLGFVRGPFTPIPEAGEVEEVFTVPLHHVLNPESFGIERRRWRSEWRRYYAVPYGPYYIWGATARILRGLADGVQP